LDNLSLFSCQKGTFLAGKEMIKFLAIYLLIIIIAFSSIETNILEEE